jgi:hypothetical protein
MAALSPAWIDADRAHAGFAPEGALWLPPSGGGEGALQRSHVYAPGEPVALLFDPTAPTLPRPLTADAAWLGALRDGAVALGLRAGDALAAPELPLVGTEPGLAFAALASGATFVHLTLDELERAPDPSTGPLSIDRPLAMLGVSPALRELVRRRQLRLGERCAAWFRDPLESTRLEPWHDFVVAAALGKTPALNLRWEAALGGAALFSSRRLGRAHYELLPAAGAAWSLVDLVDDARPVVAGPGRLALTPPGGAPSVTAAIALPQSRGWMSAGSMPAYPGGRAFPVAEARAVAAAVAGCCAAVVLHDPTSAGDPPRVVLLAFGTVTPARLYEALEAELGHDHLPDDILCFPLLPRRDDAGLPDERWCHQQLRAGALGRKAHDELHLLLSRLRARVVPTREELP